MLDFEYQENGSSLKVEMPDWSVALDAPELGLITIQTGSLLASTENAVLGEYSESMAVGGICRPHRSSSGLELSVDTERTIPFGTEPCIRRKYRIQEGRLSAVSDFVLRNSFEMNKIKAGGIAFSGRMDSIEVAALPEDSCELDACVQKSVFSEIAEGGSLWDSEKPPLSICVREAGESGRFLRFECGEDFWRWINAARIQGKSRYRIFKQDGKVIFEWDLYEFAPSSPEEEKPFGRNWRLSWEVSWLEPYVRSGKKEEGGKEFKDMLDLSAMTWKTDACVRDRNGQVLENVPCASSQIVVNAMKKWLRRCLPEAEEGDVFAVKVHPHVCYSAAHMDRAKLHVLAHRDDMALYEFSRWANRQLHGCGASLVIVKD